MRKKMIVKDHPLLSIRRQYELLDVNRNRLQGLEPTANTEDQKIMVLLDSIHVREPTFGARRLNAVLRRDHGYSLGRRRLRRLMRAARIRVSYRHPRTGIRAGGHKIYPYLLCGLEISKADQVWCTDITYIPMARGFCYLACVMDWHTRGALGWAVSTTMETTLCLDALTIALATGRCPQIINSDQGSRYTSAAWIKRVKDAGTLVSMDERDAGSTMSALRGFGAVPNMKTFTSMRTPHRVNWAKVSQTGLSATTPPARILHSTIEHRGNFTQRKQHDHFALATAFGRDGASPQTPRF